MATQREFTAEEVQKRLRDLPTEIRSLMYSDEMTHTIQKVGEKNKLHYDQMGTLELETKNVLLGFTETPDFAGILAQSLSISKEQADTVASDINIELFSKIRDTMKQSSIAITPAEKMPTPPATSVTPTASEGKSVVMPSAAKTVGAEMVASVPAVAYAATSQPIAPALVTTPPTAAPAMFTIPPVAKPAELSVPHVDAMLSQPTVSIAPQKLVDSGQGIGGSKTDTAAPAPTSIDIKKSDAPAPPPLYKTDPYHEPID